MPARTNKKIASFTSIPVYDPGDWSHTPSEDFRITLKMIPIILVLLLGFSLGLTNGPRQSSGTAGKLLAQYGGSHRTELEQAYAAVVTEDYARAVTLADSVLESEPDNALAYHIRGLGNARRGLTEEAIQSFGRAVELQPEFALARYDLGVVQESIGEFSSAFESYKEASRLDPDDFRFADAATRIEKIVIGEGGWEFQESEAVRLFMEGIAAVNRGGPDDLTYAENIYRSLLAERPYDVATRNMLGLTLAKQGKLDEAEATLIQVVEDEPGYPDAWYNLGMLHRAQGRLDEALNDFEVAYSSSSMDTFRENASREATEVRELLGGDIRISP